MTATAQAIKTAATENFPVGSWLLPVRLRPHVALFYAFAREIDDIADSATLTADDKIRQLDDYGLALDGGHNSPSCTSAIRLRQSLDDCRITHQHGHDLIGAFKQDAIKSRYNSWDELIDYCMRSAAPVGRYLLDLHSEDKRHYPLSDALCNALQVINHCQDMADDKHTLDRVYLPTDWLETVDDIDQPQLTKALRITLNRCLDATERLLVDARKLPSALTHKGLAAEASVIVAIAERLVAALRSRDPLAERVKLSKLQTAMCAVRGIARLL